MLRNWKVWQKLALIAVAMGIMVPVLLYLAVSARNEDIGFALKEEVGTLYLRPLTSLLSRLPERRGRTQALLGGDLAQRREIAALDALIDQDFTALSELDRQVGAELGTTAALGAIRQDWQNLRVQAARQSPEQSFAAHTRVVDRITTLVEDVGDSSNIRLDPLRDTFYLGEVILIWGPRAIEDRGRLRERAAGVVARGQATPEEEAELSLLIAGVDQSVAPIRRAVRLIAEDNPDFAERVKTLARESEEKTGTFLGLVRSRVQRAPAITLSSADLFASGKAAVDAQAVLSSALLERIESEFRERIAGLSRNRNLVLAATVISVLLAAFLVTFVAGLINRQVSAITGMFQRIGAGDFRARAVAMSGDELGRMAASINDVLDNTVALMQSRDERDRIQASTMKLLEEISGLAEGDLSREAEVTADMTGAIADAFNTVIAQLRRIISDVQETTLRVSSAASEIQTTTQHLADGSEAQSAQIVGTSAAVEEMALSIQQVSENAASATGVAEQALANAREGADAVSRTVEGMNSIRVQVQESAKRIKRLGESSQEIGEIVQLIGDIADRTSILALNASIQAAMAGDAGRGFAVVAEEVERLAVRSADATKRIATLIRSVQSETHEAVRAMEDTTREVVSGSGLANAAGQALGEIQGVSGRLAELIQSISTAAQQQARGSDSVAKAMGDISDNTQQTAAGTKRVAVSITNLAALADNLRGSVAEFKLPARAA
ncbi:MAG TPA: HAMP domain-containing methyl-accepting chemotaxis protein [Thermoanaerobaculia bacterium]|jgi:twitching motility protein PilJ|nr:HAMP domain-containing methyl-accepting chemotaxis protein [Thermoanaerobaculia bacterium]